MGTIADFTYGVWICEEEAVSTWKANNTPNTCVYTNLTLADSYMYLDNIIKFNVKTTSGRESEAFYGGWETSQTSDSGQITASSYGLVRCYITVTAIVTETVSENLKRFFKLHVVHGDGNKYLIHQRAATTFEQFPDVNGALKKYVEVIIRTMDFTETNDKGKDCKLVSIVFENVDQRY